MSDRETDSPNIYSEAAGILIGGMHVTAGCRHIHRGESWGTFLKAEHRST